MSILPASQAKNLLVVDPLTSLQIEHVKATDPDKCEIETYTINECVPGCEAVVRKANGDLELVNWTPVQIRDGCGNADYLTRHQYREFDLVNKYTGEVVAEARFNHDAIEEEENGNELEPTFAD